MQPTPYIVTSLELHLFFGRIMKEHSLFLRAGFTPAEPECAEKAVVYLTEFENLLCQAVELSDGIVSKDALCAQEFVTEFTALAERQTECLTGISINQELTQQTLCLKGAEKACDDRGELRRKVRNLNRSAMKLLDGLIAFKENILSRVLRGELYTVNYPLLIEHITREARLYRRYLDILERDGNLSRQSMKETETFWNQIMMEHAQFISGLLDPCECDLIHTADGFAQKFCALLEVSRGAHSKMLTERTLEETRKLRDFKAAGTQGIQENRIRSIILPLLADHVLREANHYIRLLEQ